MKATFCGFYSGIKQNRPCIALHEHRTEDVATFARNRKRNADNAIV